MEIHHCGQASELGRYPIHFHNSYDQPNSYFRGLGIWQTFNRAMTLHAVNYALIENNVAYNNMGHAYFMEDAVEHDNTVRYNLAIKTKIASSLLSGRFSILIGRLLNDFISQNQIKNHYKLIKLQLVSGLSI